MASLLGHHTSNPESIPQVLSAYDAIRRPFANGVAEKARLIGKLFHLRFDRLDFDKLTDAIKVNSEWAWMSTIDDSLEEAIHLLGTSVKASAASNGTTDC